MDIITGKTRVPGGALPRVPRVPIPGAAASACMRAHWTPTVACDPILCRWCARSHGSQVQLKNPGAYLMTYQATVYDQSKQAVKPRKTSVRMKYSAASLDNRAKQAGTAARGPT